MNTSLIFFECLAENLVRGLDDDEADFLEFVDKTRLAEESRILQEERNELEEYRKAVAKENEERLKLEVKSVAHSLPPKSSQLLPSIGVSKESQKSKLNACVVKRKCVATAVCDDSQRSKKIKGIKLAISFLNELKFRGVCSIYWN